MGGGEGDLLVLQGRDGDIEVLLLGSVSHGELHGAGVDAHAEVELRADAAVILALLGAAVPGGDVHALDGVDAARAVYGDDRDAVLGDHGFGGHVDMDGLRLILVQDGDADGVHVLPDGKALAGVLQHQHDLRVALGGVGIHGRDHQELGRLPGGEGQAVFLSGIALLGGLRHGPVVLLLGHGAQAQTGEGIAPLQLLPVRDRAGVAVAGRAQRRGTGGGRGVAALRPRALLHLAGGPGDGVLRTGVNGVSGVGLLVLRDDGVAVLVQLRRRNGGHRVAFAIHQLRAAVLVDHLAELVFVLCGLDLLHAVGIPDQVDDGFRAENDLRVDVLLIDLNGIVHIVAGAEVDDLQRDLRLPAQIACALDGDKELLRAFFTGHIARFRDEEPVFAVPEFLRYGQLDILRGVDPFVDLLRGVGQSTLAALEHHQQRQQESEGVSEDSFHEVSPPLSDTTDCEEMWNGKARLRSPACHPSEASRTE